MNRRLFFLACALPPLLAGLLLVVLPLASTLGARHEQPPDEALPEAYAPTKNERAVLDSLQSTEAFLQARLRQAESPGVSLAVDLVEHMLSLEIQGVPVRTVPLHEYRVSRLLTTHRVPGGHAAWARDPFILQHTDATVPWAPVRVVQAPRDTAEARARPPQEVPPPDTSAVYAVLHFDRGLTLVIRQSGAGLAGALVGLRERARTAGDALSALAYGRPPAHAPWIVLEVPPADARAIFRALPDSAGLALRL